MSSAAEMRTAWHRTAATCYLLNEDSKRNSPKQSGDFQWFKQDEFLKPKSLGDGWSSIHSHYFVDKKLDFHFHVENEGDSLVQVALDSDDSLGSSEWQTIDPPTLSVHHGGTMSEKLASEISSPKLGTGEAVKKTTNVPPTNVPCNSNQEFSKLQQHPVASRSVEIPKWRHANRGELAALIARKSSEDMGNCDLPPPSPATRSTNNDDLFDRQTIGEDPPASLSSSSSAFQSCSGSLDSRGRRTFVNPKVKESVLLDEARGAESRWKGLEGDSGFLGEALCRSQTRAREAEKRAAEAVSEKEKIVKLFFREASLSLAYKHWIKFLEVENLWLRRQKQETEEELEQHQQHDHKRQKSKKKRKHLVDPDHTVAVLGCTVGLAFALGVSLASAGLVFGCTMGWILFAF